MGKENMIFCTTDRRVLPDVMDMIKKSKVEGVDLKEIAYFIYQNLGKQDTKLWVAFDGEKINGFILAYLVYPVVKPEVFIAWAYADPKLKGVGQKLNAAVEKWARSLKITKISAIVRKNLEAFNKRYGYTLEYYNVSKEIKLEEDNNVRNV